MMLNFDQIQKGIIDAIDAGLKTQKAGGSMVVSVFWGKELEHEIKRA